MMGWGLVVVDKFFRRRRRRRHPGVDLRKLGFCISSIEYRHFFQSVFSEQNSGRIPDFDTPQDRGVWT